LVFYSTIFAIKNVWVKIILYILKSVITGMLFIG
jgi:hypothetical protein